MPLSSAGVKQWWEHRYAYVAVSLGTLVAGYYITQIPSGAHTVIQTGHEYISFITLIGSLFVVAGGIREDIPRAFLLHRFERWLGGGAVGLVVTSLAFGAGHLIQGIDAAIATGLLGGVWGLVYLRRRSAVAPMVSHAGFNLLQLLQFLTLGH